MKKLRLNKKTVLFIVFFILLTSIIILGKLGLNKYKEYYKTNKYVLLEDILLDYDKIGDYSDGLIAVSKDKLVGFADNNGNIVIDFKYDISNLYASFNNGYAVLNINNKYNLINKNGETVLKSSYDYIYGNEDNTYTASLNSKYGLIDNKENVIIPFLYEGIFKNDDFYVGLINQKETIYSKTGDIILKNIILKYKSTNEGEEGFELNNNFIVVKDTDNYKIYLVNSKEYINTSFKNVTLYENYAFASTDNKTIIYDYNGKIIKEINDVYGDFIPLSQKFIGVYNDKCKNNDDYLYNNYSLYNIDGKIIYDGCYRLEKLYNSKYISMIDEKKHVLKVLDDDGSVLIEEQSDDYISAIFTEYNNIKVYKNDNSVLYTTNGKKVLSQCKFIDQLSKDLYLCNSIETIGYLSTINDIVDKKIINYANNSDNYISIIYANGDAKIIDNYNNEIIFGSNITVNYIDKNIIIYSHNEKYYIRKIKYVNKNDYNKGKNDLINHKQEKFDYKSIKIEKIIKDYKLTDKESINNNKELFQKVSYHVINNTNLLYKHQKKILELFNSIVDFSKYNDVSVLLKKLSKLTIEVYKTKPDGMTSWAVGTYNDVEIKIRLLEDYEDYAFKHELLHFISYARNTKYNEYNDYIYDCKNGFKNIEEISNISFNEQTKCTLKVKDNYNFFEEVGAEYYSKYYYSDEFYESYYEPVLSFNILKYAIDENSLLNIEYSPYRDFEFFKVISNKLKFNYKEVEDLYNDLQLLMNMSQNYNYNYNKKCYIIYKAADDLIDAYNITHINNIEDNEFFSIGIYYLIKDYNLACALKCTDNNISIKYVNYYNKLSNLLANRLKSLNYSIINKVNIIVEDNIYAIKVSYYDKSYKEKIVTIYYNEVGNFKEFKY